MKRLCGRLVAATALTLMFACGSDDGEPIPDAGTAPDTGVRPDGGEPPCEEIDPTFAALHDELFSTNTCALSSCHAAAGASISNNFRLDEGREAAYMAVLGDTTDEDGMVQYPTRVVPGQPDQSYLFQQLIRDDPANGVVRMPSGSQNGLPQCQIDAVEQWILNGAMNDG